MDRKIDTALLQKQANSLKKQMPELFGYLTERDEATAEMVQALARTIPKPDDLPEFKIPFIDAVIEALKPKAREDCRVCDEHDGQLWILTAEQQARLCHYCLHGIYLRGSGVRGLTDG